MISLTKVTAGYDKFVVLHDITIAFRTGRFTALLGPNGSGKSTLLKAIVGLATVQGGSIRLGERELRGVETESLVEMGLAYAPQRKNVFTSMSVRENLLLAGRRMKKAQASEAIARVRELFPILAAREHQSAGSLSGGERQMLAIAMSCLPQPQVMLLDEPTAGLAPLVMNEVLRVLKLLSEQGITLIVVEQNARSLLRWCEDVAVLREGRLVFEGTAEYCRDDWEQFALHLAVTGQAQPAANGQA